MPDGSLGSPLLNRSLLNRGPSASPLPGLRRGRGAVSNPANRFERARTDAFDDGWGTLAQALADLPPLATSLTRDASRSALTWNDSPDIGFDRSVNPYRGCEHGCIYCYARPTHAWIGLSPGLDFEARLQFKPEVATLLEKELRKPGYVPRPIALGSNTDPYQPVERTLGLTRQVLEVLDRFNHPVTIVTKSAGVLRDMDILTRMAARNLVQVCLSVTTLDNRLARIMEPRAAAPLRRLAAMHELSRAGIPVGVLVAPVIPGVNDAEMEKVLEASHAHGARAAGYVLLRLPLEIRQMFEEWLNAHMPDRAARVLALIRETRAGKTYDSRFGIRQTGTGPYADMLAQRFTMAMKCLGLDKAREYGGLDCSRFAVPQMEERQLELL
ncbi:PA0069 family radical SAM protein [Roseomonas xinghualingensis]|uniref:PA0069 family radical SAM protein n=1 Tax=Roseomonas xinghualingensis TaxID=2986475 RepID=UPI0021F221F0|nr:PA0069 family radical SAM protein [Roseomonas sp. SXEYE001]MCV4206208.1 PA0069 family radical SAM protein [Roseomonas sp. SXEYE001]